MRYYVISKSNAGTHKTSINIRPVTNSINFFHKEVSFENVLSSKIALVRQKHVLVILMVTSWIPVTFHSKYMYH